jgi:SAM-dependent methyltransferase
MSSFDSVENVWSSRLGNLRNVVRQHVLKEQLLEHLEGVRTVLDVGCGQGTQAIELAARGLRVTGVDPSADLLARMRDSAHARQCPVEAVQGGIEDLAELLADRAYDLVCAHGLLMYLPDGRAALEQLVRLTRVGGLISFTVRNGDALAYRPGVRRRWRAALEAFDATTYVNELGASARADRLDEVLSWCDGLGLRVERWYGVRVLTDGCAADERPVQSELAECLAAEVEAGRRDPYRRLGSQLHVIARRT